MISPQALLAAERRHSWHPFTQMQEWCAPGHEPIILTEGEGALLRDIHGREYLDGNSSIWTNLHGHRHPRLNAAIAEQLGRVAHVSFLGFTHPLAIQLATELCALWPPGTLTRAFFSDDGSTAMEAAIKMAILYRQHTGEPTRNRFIAFTNAYHGDTMGASSLGGVRTFHGPFAAHHFPVLHVRTMEELEALRTESGEVIDPTQFAAVVIEPLIQGVAEMHLWPKGMLARLRRWCDLHGIHLILDEVMTGFGRTGTLFACEQEGVIPDFIALAKGLTGGYLPLAATLTREPIYEAFLGRYEELKSFFYGHSYTANPLGCAAALANLQIFREENTLAHLQEKIGWLAEELEALRPHPRVHGIRQCGFIAAFDITAPDGEKADWRLQTGARLCRAAARHGLLTRPIRDTVVLMPPYCITRQQIRQMVAALAKALEHFEAEEPPPHLPG